MRLFCLIHISIILMTSNLFSQAPDTLWTKFIGGGSADYGVSFQKTRDNGYIILAETQSYGAGERDAWLIKTDSLGDTLWTKTFGEDRDDFLGNVIQTKDGGYALSVTISYTDWLIKTDSLGNTLWMKDVDSAASSGVNCIEEFTDGSIVLSGYSRDVENVATNTWLYKFNSVGDSLWLKRFIRDRNQSFRVIKKIDNHSLIIAGRINSEIDSSTNIWLLKVDELGDTIWTKEYGDSNNELAYNIEQTKDGGYVICGLTKSDDNIEMDGWLIKTNDLGDSLWSKVFGGNEIDYIMDVKETNDSGLILCGLTETYGTQYYDIWIIKTDGVGDTSWTKTIGGLDNSYPGEIIQLKDGGYMICGTFANIITDGFDVCLIRLDSEGTAITLPIDFKNKNLVLNDNAINRNLSINFNLLNRSDVNLSIFNTQGKLIKTLINSSLPAIKHSVIWDYKELASGNYICKLTINKNSLARNIIIKR